MVNADFDVLIEDKEGNVIVDEVMNAGQNGFIDLWLPRDKNYVAFVSYNELKAELDFSTFKGDNTCITTMQLT